jgi:hypothetical protein
MQRAKLEEVLALARAALDTEHGKLAKFVIDNVVHPQLRALEAGAPDKPIVYLGSPLRPQAGDPGWPLDVANDHADRHYMRALEENTTHAEHACNLIARAGGVPYAPHLLFPRFFDDRNADERALSIGCGLKMITICDEAWFYLPTWRSVLSTGMTGEKTFAEKIGVPTREAHDTIAFQIHLDRLTAGEILQRAA